VARQSVAEHPRMRIKMSRVAAEPDQTRPLEIAIVGMGAWGLAVLEELLSICRSGSSASKQVVVHVVEPGDPGAGVYSVSQPGYLLMNTPCGQISLYPGEPAEGQLPYQLGLYQWARDRGYSWNDGVCEIDAGGTPVTEHDFLPRRDAGRYLQWFYRALLDSVPSGVSIIHHRDTAIDVRAAASGREQVPLASGHQLEVDQVVLTTGHTPNREVASQGRTMVPPETVVSPNFELPPHATVAVSGMGLVATDVLSALTVGRGGQFTSGPGGLRYRASGREPSIRFLSRSGLPYCAKAVGMRNVTTTFKPAIWTETTIASLREASTAANSGGQLNWQRELFPLLLGEMTVQYYAQATLLRDGPESASRVRKMLASAWEWGVFPECVQRLTGRFGVFDPRDHFYPDTSVGLFSSRDYHDYVRGLVAQDLKEAERPGGTSPVKMAYEVLRFLRDPIRRAVEFGGLDAESHQAFFPSVSKQITRLVAGPPAVRARQLLALVEAGVVTFPYGPSPHIDLDGSGGAEIRSTQLRHAHSEHVDVAVRGYLESPEVHRSASPLIENLNRQGRLRQLQRGGEPAAGVEMTRDSHPVDAEGRVEERLWLFGAITEGTRYFTNCIPSPGSRRWSFEEAHKCARQILA
jgi:uncharacterized NAD(P)/FAD-binding protein YdhS